MTKKNPKVKFITLGCRVNQYETQSMREALSREGFLTVSSAASGNDDDHLRKAGGRKISEADFVVINTCTVTGEADRESRYWIRRARREHPKARIVVTGCGVERDRPAIRIMSEVDRLVPNTEKPEIARHLLTDGEEPPCSEMSGTEEKKRGYPPLSISCSEGKTRAFIKIQDGCNHACSFCKVVLVRGGSRSRPPDDVLREVERLRDAGYRDVVFTGIQLGAYGRDLSEKRLCALPRLLETCSRIEGIERLRLSSIEPTDIEPDMISALRGIPKCMPHLHVPLQSGDDEILRRMNRRYDSRFYSDLVERLRSEIPDFTLTLDVMAGFPGEGESHFSRTLQLLEKVRPLKCHVFPYSRREGTRASKFSDAVSPLMIRERVRRLTSLGRAWGAEVMAQYIGREADVLVEGVSKRTRLQAERMLYGHTPNFMKVGFPGKEAWAGRVIRVKLTGVADCVLTGVPIDRSNQKNRG